jgi:hypothetical protein
MRIPKALLLPVLAAACGLAVAGQPAPSAADPDSVTIHYLLDSAAADFRAHPPKAVAFRKVYFGQFDAEGQAPQYEICGEFQVAKPGGKTEWLHFVTIRTSGYEQYVGVQAPSYCTREGMSWDEDDWSAELLERYRKN